MKTTSSKLVISKVISELNPSTSDWIVEAIEWIGEGLSEMKHGLTMEDVIPACVSDYRCKIPCTLLGLDTILYENKPLLHINDRGATRGKDSIAVTPPKGREWYTINPDWIHTSFECGEIVFIGAVVPVDCDGFPLIPDTANHREALKWKILANMISRGYKHHVFTYADAHAMWEKYFPRAKNEVMMPGLIQMRDYQKKLTAWVIDDHAVAELYNTNRYMGVKPIEAILPKDNPKASIIV
jgi:hypothetical protein